MSKCQHVLGRSPRGVVLESEARLQTTGKGLVRDEGGRGACHGVAAEDFRPGGSAAVRRVDDNFPEDFVKRAELPGLIAKELPEPVLQHHF